MFRLPKTPADLQGTRQLRRPFPIAVGTNATAAKTVHLDSERLPHRAETRMTIDDFDEDYTLVDAPTFLDFEMNF